MSSKDDIRAGAAGMAAPAHSLMLRRLALSSEWQ